MPTGAEVALTLTVLGCETPYPRPDRPCSGYLLQAGDHAVWVDAGSGTLAELQRHVGLADVDAIWISHVHPDHFADLVAAWNAYANDSSLPRPHVFGPPGWTDRLDGALGQPGSCAKVFETVELTDRLETAVGPIQLRAYEVHHSVPTFGLRAECDGRVLAYTADSGPCDALTELGRSAHLLVIEAGAKEPEAYHCTPEDAANVAQAARSERVLLTHVAPHLPPTEALRRFQITSELDVGIGHTRLIIEV